MHLGRLPRRGIELVEAEPTVDPEGRRVVTSSEPLVYDRLVVALGAELAPELVPGFAEPAHDVFVLDELRLPGRLAQDARQERVVEACQGAEAKGGNETLLRLSPRLHRLHRLRSAARGSAMCRTIPHRGIRHGRARSVPRSAS
ncbi:MAG TPA: hypothetical protein VNK94_03695 [Gaiellaceae bacterium]|nr:hypothetical protein [Gaiellaceae bacterium]